MKLTLLVVEFVDWRSLISWSLVRFCDFDVMSPLELNSPFVIFIDVPVVEKRFHRSFSKWWCLQIDSMLDICWLFLTRWNYWLHLAIIRSGDRANDRLFYIGICWTWVGSAIKVSLAKEIRNIFNLHLYADAMTKTNRGCWWCWGYWTTSLLWRISKITRGGGWRSQMTSAATWTTLWWTRPPIVRAHWRG